MHAVAPKEIVEVFVTEIENLRIIRMNNAWSHKDFDALIDVGIGFGFPHKIGKSVAVKDHSWLLFTYLCHNCSSMPKCTNVPAFS